MTTGLRTAADAYAERARAIYDDAYAETYPSLYGEPWPAKHRLNLAILDRLISDFAPRSPRWLDLACGQAWHFSMLRSRARLVGVDISEAQLARARRLVPDATFLRADMTKLRFAPGSLDLVTNFWAGYCYLGTVERICQLVRNAVGWIAQGGALYFEVLLGEDLATFNSSRFAGRTGFSVVPRSSDFSEWQYEDSGGRHLMSSPPLDRFLEILSPLFRSLEAEHDGSFMTHLVARGRR